MRFLVCPSPQILDHSFPRTEDELEVIAISLGHIIEKLEEKNLALLHTNTLDDFISSYYPDWNQYPMLRDVWVALNQLISHPSQELIYEDLLQVENYIPHLIPQKSTSKKDTESLLDLWMDELGKILILHDQCIEKNEFFIGIACPYGFSGGELDTYDNPTDQRVFPLVGLETFEKFLVDADEWYIPIKMDISNKSVDINNLERNYSVIGISHIDSEKGRGSHRVLVIDGHRDISLPKPQRKGDKSVQDYVLKELAQTFNYSIDVIKYALIEGELPERRCKLERLKSKK